MKETKNSARLYRADITEATLRRRGLDVAVLFSTVKNFDIYNSGYLQALEDLKVEKEYIKTYKKVMSRVRESFKNDRAYHKIMYEIMREKEE